MILRNNNTKGRYITYKVNGIPTKIWIGAHQKADEPLIENGDQVLFSSIDRAKRNIDINLPTSMDLLEEYASLTSRRDERVLISQGAYFYNDNNWVISSRSGGMSRTTEGASGLTKTLTHAHGYVKMSVVDNHMWSVGHNDDIGYVYYSSDSGITWTKQSDDTFPRLWGVYFLDEDKGWCTATTGEILHTENGGSVWTAQTSGIATAINDINFPNALTGYCCGASGKILKTTDGGSVWTAQTSGIATALQKVAFYNSMSGFCMGSSGKILKTTDGGATWASKTSNTTGNVNDMLFLDPLSAICVGANYVSKTVDGGETWVVNTSANFNIKSIWTIKKAKFSDDFFATGSPGTSVLSTAVIFNSKDSGETWTNVYSGMNIYNSFMFSENEGFCVNTEGGLLYTEDGWLNFSKSLELNVATTYSDVFFANRGVGWYCSGGTSVYLTTDSGTTWTKKSLGTSFNPYKIFATDENNVWVCGSAKTMRVSNDGGNTWSSQTVDAAAANFIIMDMFMYNSNVGIAGGADGRAYYTSNGGNTWTSASTNTSEWLNGFFMISDRTGWACGDAGTVLKTEDGGMTWSALNSGTQEDLDFVVFYDLNLGYIAGRYGVLKYTTDGGQNWTGIQTNTLNQIRQIWMFDKYRLFCTGSGDLAFSTIKTERKK